jgi:Ca2+-binding RTX toxin-like protein
MGGHNEDTLYGGDGDDTLLGDEHNDTVYGQAGDDALLGQWDIDFLDSRDGTQGNDLLVGGAESDTCTSDPDHARQC